MEDDESMILIFVSTLRIECFLSPRIYLGEPPPATSPASHAYESVFLLKPLRTSFRVSLKFSSSLTGWLNVVSSPASQQIGSSQADLVESWPSAGQSCSHRPPGETNEHRDEGHVRDSMSSSGCELLLLRPAVPRLFITLLLSRASSYTVRPSQGRRFGLLEIYSAP
jgi:hypothetical protein